MNQKGRWYKGYTHYHSSFRYPEAERITPLMLADDLRKLGADFAFCAGDHGNFKGDNYFGIDIREFDDYRNVCLTASEEYKLAFVPAPEIHLMFPPFNERHEHHSCLPILGHIPSLELPETRSLAASYTRDVETFVNDVNTHNVAVTLNHPYLSMHSGFNGPDPLSLQILRRLDYLELYTIDHPDKFPLDFAIYLNFLADPVSARMACCGSVDNACHPDWSLSSEKRIVPATGLYTAGAPDLKNIMAAWNDRRSYTVYGEIQIDRIEPIPSKKSIETVKNPFISLAVNSRKKVTQAEIYRNGKQVYAGKEFSSWRDENPLPGENHYIVHVTAEDEHLVTSPINYFVDRRN